jgi:hypothetical protein
MNTVMAREVVSDELAFELTGFRPEQMNEREAAIIRERARRRWAVLCAISAASPQSADDTPHE